MGEPITMETVRAGGLREAGHLNYGKHGGGTIWQHTTIRRLKAIDRPALTDEERRKHRGGLREWSVDGARATSLEDAIAALNVPTVLTEEEAEVLAHVPSDWVRLHDFRTALAETLSRQVAIDLMSCGDKGFTETDMRPGKERREPWIRRKQEP
ncbi:hypothetical protein [Methylobacterium brachiatum]|uniref:hypothetical protein n=1 Tax=Methylobacterium brachiatum TaxID=269660 RepID=UPI0024479DB6|nr:hypothetical protein [Methylobacterium brachiatum]MDH2313388.1 hypothetical protein [Methylobacterium brachiatum]